MPQNWTTIVFGSLIFAFLFFITVRGDLAKFLGVFGLAAGGSGGSSAAPSFGNITGSGQNSSIVPAIGGSGFGTLPSITGNSLGFDSGTVGSTGPTDTGWLSV